jgi:hypothetical protein
LKKLSRQFSSAAVSEESTLAAEESTSTVEEQTAVAEQVSAVFEEVEEQSAKAIDLAEKIATEVKNLKEQLANAHVNTYIRCLTLCVCKILILSLLDG